MEEGAGLAGLGLLSPCSLWKGSGLPHPPLHAALPIPSLSPREEQGDSENADTTIARQQHCRVHSGKVFYSFSYPLLSPHDI